MAVAAAVGQLQSQRDHRALAAEAEALHRAEMAAATAMTAEAETLAAALHARALRRSRELYRAGAAHHVDLARMEAVRDNWARQAQLGQGLLLTATLVLSIAAAVLCEAELPVGTSVWIVRAQGLLLGVGHAAVLLAIWATLMRQGRMAAYDSHRPGALYSCGRRHVTFVDFFDCHCRPLEVVIFALLYAGTACTVAAGGVFVTAMMVSSMKDPLAGAVFAVLTAAAVAVAAYRVPSLAIAGCRRRAGLSASAECDREEEATTAG